MGQTSKFCSRGKFGAGVLTHVASRTYPAIRAFESLTSRGGSTGIKTLCMPGEGERVGVRVPDAATSFFFLSFMSFLSYFFWERYLFQRDV